MATWKEWSEFFEKNSLQDLKTWDEALKKLPRMIFNEFEGLRFVHGILQNEIAKRQQRWYK